MIVNFSCPNCGADMSYDIKLGKLHCAHCDHSEDIRPDEENYKNAAEEPADKQRYCVNCGGLLSILWGTVGDGGPSERRLAAGLRAAF